MGAAGSPHGLTFSPGSRGPPLRVHKHGWASGSPPPRPGLPERSTPAQHPKSPLPWSSKLNIGAGRPHGEGPG